MKYVLLLPALAAALVCAQYQDCVCPGTNQPTGKEIGNSTLFSRVNHYAKIDNVTNLTVWLSVDRGATFLETGELGFSGGRDTVVRISWQLSINGFVFNFEQTTLKRYPSVAPVRPIG